MITDDRYLLFGEDDEIKSFHAPGPREPEDDDDDENITGDEDLYGTVENEEPADEEDVLEEQEDALGEEGYDEFDEEEFTEE